VNKNLRFFLTFFFIQTKFQTAEFVQLVFNNRETAGE